MSQRKQAPRTRNSRFEQKADPRFEAVVSYEMPKKKFSQHDMKTIQPLTRSQESVFDHWEDDYCIILNGFAGCGKTFLAIYLAMKEILSGESQAQKLLIVRSAAPTKDQGFLPGTLEEKNAVYELPYEGIFAELFKRSNQYQLLKESGKVEFATTSYPRGVTWDNTIIVFDEFASATYHELSTIITRLGKNSKIILCGDENQNDLVYDRKLESGFTKFMRIANMMPNFRTVNFEIEDCVRSGLVKEFLIAEHRYNEMKKG